MRTMPCQGRITFPFWVRSLRRVTCGEYAFPSSGRHDDVNELLPVEVVASVGPSSQRASLFVPLPPHRHPDCTPSVSSESHGATVLLTVSSVE